MTIWLLALVLLASLAALGYRQGGIRVGMSFFGILAGALLALPLGKLFRPLLSGVGFKDPLLLWLIPPFIAFVIINGAFKAGAAALHQKVDVWYKYKGGDLRLALWERLNHRLGLCLGLLNGTAYLALVSFVIYMLSYWTFQVASPEGDPFALRLLNRAGEDLHNSGLARVARSIDRLSPSYYKAADIAGLMYNNPLLEARLESYPAFLSLGERPEFQSLGADKEFIEMRQKRVPVMQLLDKDTAAGIRKNPDVLRTLWAAAEPNLADLRVWLETGKSPKFESKPILGRWKFNVASAYNLLRRSRPNMASAEMKRYRAWISSAFDNVRLVATTENQVILKNLPPLKLPTVPGTPQQGAQTLQGTWKDLNDPTKYLLSFPGAGKEDVPAIAEEEKLTFTSEGIPLVFNREE